MVVPTHASAKSPHMVIFAATATVSAVIQLIADEQPTTLMAAVSPLIATIWSLLCAIGGISVIVGTYLRNPLKGLMVEQTGHFAIGVGYLAYCITLAYHMTGVWYVSTAFWWSIAFVLASALRGWMIRRVIQEAKRKVERQRLLQKRGDTDGH